MIHMWSIILGMNRMQFLIDPENWNTKRFLSYSVSLINTTIESIEKNAHVSYGAMDLCPRKICEWEYSAQHSISQY